jgi:hypothetical protein
MKELGIVGRSKGTRVHCKTVLLSGSAFFANMTNIFQIGSCVFAQGQSGP